MNLNRDVRNRTTFCAAGLFAGMAVTVWSPRSVPYVAAGLVVLAVGAAITDRLWPSGKTAE